MHILILDPHQLVAHGDHATIGRGPPFRESTHANRTPLHTLQVGADTVVRLVRVVRLGTIKVCLNTLEVGADTDVIHAARVSPRPVFASVVPVPSVEVLSLSQLIPSLTLNQA